MIYVAVNTKSKLTDCDFEWVTNPGQLAEALDSKDYDVYAVDDERVEKAFIAGGQPSFLRAMFLWLVEGWADEKFGWQRRADGVIRKVYANMAPTIGHTGDPIRVKPRPRNY